MTEQSHAPETPETRTERLIDGLLRGIFVIRIPLAMGVLSILVLTLSDQVLEVHRVLTQERAQDVFNVHWLLALASLVALSLVLWQMARQHAEYAAEDVPGEHVVAHPAVHLGAEVGTAPGRHAAAAGRRARHLAEPSAQPRRRRHAGHRSRAP